MHILRYQKILFKKKNYHAIVPSFTPQASVENPDWFEAILQ
jgi:hypothetical protein